MLVQLAPAEPVGLAAHTLRVSLALQQSSHNRYWVDDFAGQGFSLPQLRQASLFSLELHEPHAEDGLLAAGAALALGKASLYVVSNRPQLPWFLQEADLAYPHQVTILTRDQRLPSQAELSGALGSVHSSPLPATSLVEQPVDSFIGCLMSKLTAAEYAEGRTHLLAIRDSLRNFGGQISPYCEGINVVSSASFDTPKRALQIDMEALHKARQCIFYLYDGRSRPSGMWVELGAALAWEKPSLLLTPSRQALPPCLQQEPLPGNLRIVVYNDHAGLLKALADPDQAGDLLAP